MTINSRIIETFFNWSPDATDVPLKNGLRIQILPTMDDLGRARKHQFAAFVASAGLLVVWDDDAMNLIPRARAIEKELMELVWNIGQPGDTDRDNDEKKGPLVTAYEINEETGMYTEHRPTNLSNAVNVGLTLFLVAIMLGLGFRAVIVEIMIDNSFIRVAFVAMAPVQIFFTLASPRRFTVLYHADNRLVLCASHCGMCCSDHWPRQTGQGELEVLFCASSATIDWSAASSCHDPVSSL